MWLKSILSLLVLPPVNLVFAILAGVALQRRAPRLGRGLTAVAAVLLLLLAMPAVSGTLLCALERNLPLTPPAGKPPQAIVVLGAELIRTPHHGAVIGRLSLERVLAAAALERRTGLPVLVSGGQLSSEPPPIAVVMRNVLVQDFHVPVEWVEDRSLDTWQNARDSAAILHAHNIDSIYLVTHAWHERRALIAFRGTGIAVTAAPVVLDRPPTPILADFLPRVSAWLVSYYALHEWVGCLWYEMP